MFVCSPGSVQVHSRVSLPLDQLLAEVRSRGLLTSPDSLLKHVTEKWSRGLVKKNYNGKTIDRCSMDVVSMNLIDPLNPSSGLTSVIQ
jgi:hypothetical protein